MNNKELWLEMLTTYVKRFNYTSITIPNMVAAYYQADNLVDLTSYQCVKSILEEIVSSESGYRVLVQRCHELHHYTFSIFLGVGKDNIDDRIFFNMYDEDLKDNGEYTIDGVAKKLYEAYKEPMKTKSFSYDKYNGVWRVLNELEIETIKEILKG